MARGDDPGGRSTRGPQFDNDTGRRAERPADKSATEDRALAPEPATREPVTRDPVTVEESATTTAGATSAVDELVEQASRNAPVDDSVREHRGGEVLFGIVEAEVESDDGQVVKAGGGINFGIEGGATVERTDDGALIEGDFSTPTVGVGGDVVVTEQGADISVRGDHLDTGTGRLDAKVDLGGVQARGGVETVRGGSVGAGAVEVGATNTVDTEGSVSLADGHAATESRTEVGGEVDLGLVSVSADASLGIDARIDEDGVRARVDPDAGLEVDDRTGEFAGDLDDARADVADFVQETTMDDTGESVFDAMHGVFRDSIAAQQEDKEYFDEKTAPVREAIESTARDVLDTEAGLSTGGALDVSAAASIGDLADARAGVGSESRLAGSVSSDGADLDGSAGGEVGFTGRIGEAEVDASAGGGAAVDGSVGPDGADVGGGFGAESSLDLGVVSGGVSIDVGGRIGTDGVSARLRIGADAGVAADADQAASDAQDAVDELRGAAEDFGESTGEAVGSAVEQAMDVGGDLADDAAENVQAGTQFMSGLSGRAHETSMTIIENIGGGSSTDAGSTDSGGAGSGDAGGDAWGDTADAVGDAVGDAVDTGEDLVDDAEDWFEDTTGIDLDGDDDDEADDDDGGLFDTVTSWFS